MCLSTSLITKSIHVNAAIHWWCCLFDHCNGTFKQIPITVKMVTSRCKKAKWWLAEICTLYLILPLVFIAFTITCVSKGLFWESRKRIYPTRKYRCCRKEKRLRFNEYLRNHLGLPTECFDTFFQIQKWKCFSQEWSNHLQSSTNPVLSALVISNVFF